MSSAPARIPPFLGRVVRGITWTIVLGVMSAAGAGLLATTWHAPGSPARAELTYAGDTALAPRLQAAIAQLQVVSQDVSVLASEAKTALSEIVSSDPTRLRDALQRGALASGRVDDAARALRTSLAGLPGDGPTAVLDYSNATLFRRAAILAAIDAATGLAAQWQHVSGRAADASNLIALIDGHDVTVLDAASKGRANQFADAAKILDEALFAVSEVQLVRERLIAGTEHTVLDEWIQRTGAYDLALKRLYLALNKSKGDPNTLDVQAARSEERAAFSQLPEDRRTIVVIVAEVARSGLTQAVVAIEDAHGRIDAALEELPA
jgi:hypothetical protein